MNAAPDRTAARLPSPGGRAALLHLRGVVKAYPGVLALNGVDLDIHEGEVHAVLGGNGAGKSTLAKVIGGVERADEGEIVFDGREINGLGPSGTRDLGIAIVHQRLALFPSLTVAENLAWLLGEYPSRAGLIASTQLRARARQVLAVLGDRDISPLSRVSDLRPAEWWLVAIAAALARRPRLLVLDESTAALPEADADELFGFLRDRRDEGLGVMMVTHRLDEIDKIADRVTVLTDGRVSGQSDGGGTADLVSLMFGNEVAAKLESAHRRGDEFAGEALLRLDDVRTRKLRGLSLAVKPGEILGIAGAFGSGRSEIVRTLLGDSELLGGEIVLRGEPYRPSGPAEAIARGVAAVPEKAEEQGVLHGLSVRRNIALTALDRVCRGPTPLLNRRREREVADRLGAELSIKGTGGQPIETLSGGNRQKALLARALLLGADVLLLDEPSQGVDVATRLELRRILHSLADEGRAVVVVSSEFDDLIRDCSRIAVVRGGRVVEDDAPFSSEALAHLAYAGAPR